MPENKIKAEPASQSASIWDPVDGSTIEVATGLSLQDVEALKANADEDTRAEIAAKFAVQYDRLHRSKSHKLTDDLLQLFSEDKSKKIRLLIAKEVRASQHLNSSIAATLARDDLEIATPILESSPVLSDTDLEGIIKEMPEPYAIVIAGRQPLGENLTEMLLEHKGTTKVISRLIENSEAVLSEAVFASLYEWGRSDVDIATRLERRPNLPLDMVEKYMGDLGEQLDWKAITTRTMTRSEMTQLQWQIYGTSRKNFPRNGTCLSQVLQSLKNRHAAGTLTPYDIIALLRDNKVDLVEFSLAVVTSLDLKRIRNLLYGSDRRGLVALCLTAGFTTAEYLAFRMVLGLVELGIAIDRPKISYEAESTRFAQTQFEAMRSQPGQIDAWIDGCPVFTGSARQ